MSQWWCYACPDGKNKIIPQACAGRFAFFKGVEIEIPASFLLPTCESCGAEWLDQQTAKELDDALTLVYEQKTNITK